MERIGIQIKIYPVEAVLPEIHKLKTAKKMQDFNPQER